MRKLILTTLALVCAGIALAAEGIPASSPEIRYMGRTLAEGDAVSFDWSGTSVECRFTGPSLAVRASDTKKNYYNLTIDGRDGGVVTISGRDTLIVLASGLGRGEHTVRMQKRTEGEQGRTTLHAFELAKGGRLLPAAPAPVRHIEFIGNSLTAGYGTEGLTKDEPFKPETENCNKAYACIIARYFGAGYTLIAHSGRGAARNYGDKNTTSKNTMADRVANTFDESPEPVWEFARSPYKPDLVVINLGSNDFSTLPHPSQEEFGAAYMRILETLRKGYGDAMPILCVAPRVNEPAFDYIREIVRTCGLPEVHFAAILPGYCNDDSDLGSSAHPNYQGQRKMALLLIPYVSTLTGWDAEVKPVE